MKLFQQIKNNNWDCVILTHDQFGKIPQSLDIQKEIIEDEIRDVEEALEVYDKIPSERMNADKCIGFCIEEDGGFVGMYELVVNDKVQRENINSINYFRDDKLVQQAISDMEKLMAARQQSKEQERSNTKKSVLDALRSLKAKKQEQPAQDKPKKAKKNVRS